ncbi:hypothetical protein [Phaeobacter sp. 22II1-1F12B]|uniref:hypothetical protein n=1 Tax=Phaeobacter sp. 22II1-1F12B TaxID=1317111 RepID=UPI0018E990B1|nr:hypothetical protein [Phaeobacter sp. 22II1-1F12B]
MPIKAALTALALTLVPTLGLALGCSSEKRAQSCAEGTSWDTETQSCVKQVTG